MPPTPADPANDPGHPGGTSSDHGARSGLRRLVGRTIERLSVGEGTVDRPPLGDVLLAAALCLPAALGYLLDPGEPAGVLTAGWVRWPLLVTMYGALAWRRVTPTLTMAVTGLSTGAWYLLGPGEPTGAGAAVPLAVMVALYSVSAYGSRFDGIFSLLVSEVFVLLSMLSVMAAAESLSLSSVVVNVLLFLGLWALGDRTRVRRDLVHQLTARAQQAERSHALAAELAVADERTRIARELHDVIAHTVSVVVVQAGAGRRVAVEDPAGARSALSSIETIGREALADLRRMVGVLRDETPIDGLAPHPTLADVPELVDRLAAAGLPVDARVDGEPRLLPSGVEVSAYRVVQEALTNVLKHAGEVRRVEVVLDYTPGSLIVSVADDGRGPAVDPMVGAEPGSGVVGMRERVAMFGGHLEAGARSGGGYRVRATVPLPPAEMAEDPGEEHPVRRGPAEAGSVTGTGAIEGPLENTGGPGGREVIR